MLDGARERSHAAHGRPDDRVEAIDAEVLQHRLARVGYVLEAEHRKGGAVSLTGSRVPGRRARGPETAAQGVDADNKEAAGINRA